MYNTIGPGLLESAYEAALVYELNKLNLDVQSQLVLPMIYDSVRVDAAYRIDILVNKKVIIEIKSVEYLLDVHHKQLLTYWRLSGKKMGILVNFNCAEIDKNIFRKVNNL